MCTLNWTVIAKVYTVVLPLPKMSQKSLWVWLLIFFNAKSLQRHRHCYLNREKLLCTEHYIHFASKRSVNDICQFGSIICHSMCKWYCFLKPIYTYKCKHRWRWQSFAHFLNLFMFWSRLLAKLISVLLKIIYLKNLFAFKKITRIQPAKV